MPNHVIVSTLGWSKEPLEAALKGIAALDFSQVELAVIEGWAHINPSQLVEGGREHIQAEANRVQDLVAQAGLRRVSAIAAGLKSSDPDEQRARWTAVCDLAQALDVQAVRLDAAKRGTPVEEEVIRLQELVAIAKERGVTLAVETHANQITELPDVAVRLCEAVPGLALTLDPSHYYAGPNQGADFSAVLPYVRHVHLRDAGSDWDHIQVPAGSGLVDFTSIVGGLHALGYDGKFAIEYIDSIPIRAKEGEPADVPANVIRMRDQFLAAERGAGIQRIPAPAAQ